MAQTLSEKISDLLSTAPSTIDPEDDDNFHAKVIDKEYVENEVGEGSDAKGSAIRKQNLELLEAVDTRYAGKRGSRKDLHDESFSEEDEFDDVESDTNTESVGDEVVSEAESDENQSAEDDVSSFQHISQSNVNNQVEKGVCVKNQLLIWESLLETRIKLQKCLVSANKLPQTENYEAIRQQCNDRLDPLVSQVTLSLTHVLDNMFHLQKMLMNAYPETRNLETQEKVSHNEIPSDSETEQKVETDHTEPPPPKRSRLDDYEKQISETHSKYTKYRNNVIRKWNEKTRISVAKNLINKNSIINQVEFILKDREKCLRRTRTQRSNYQIIGEGDEKQEYNAEIFDDDDFYHQLLRELIEFKSSDITDPVKLSQQWIQLQSMRSKMKRNVDTRATKGRKIRYAVHSKLVNFMAPIPDNKWTDAAKNELYHSLFGGRKK